MKPRRPATASCLRAVLEPSFFDRPADQVARDLLGKALLRRIGRNHRTFVITETEAYLGPHDLACHSAWGRTPRTEVMFGPPGTLYIYLVYGLHWMLNVVTGPPGSAVLLRSAGACLALADWERRLPKPVPSMARRQTGQPDCGLRTARRAGGWPRPRASASTMRGDSGLAGNCASSSRRRISARTCHPPAFLTFRPLTTGWPNTGRRNRPARQQAGGIFLHHSGGLRSA
jgi:hypothetical protein